MQKFPKTEKNEELRKIYEGKTEIEVRYNELEGQIDGLKKQVKTAEQKGIGAFLD